MSRIREELKEVPPAPRLAVLWAIPRSLSTAFAKAMSLAPTVQLVHEPWTDAYYFSPGRRSCRYGLGTPYQQTADGNAIESQLERFAVECGCFVFVKELAFQALPFVSSDFIAGVQNAFIIRHPALVHKSLAQLKPDYNEEEFGFQSVDSLVRTAQSLGKTPIIVDAEQFREYPDAIMSRFCAIVGVAFEESMLSWETGAIRNWTAGERFSQAKWHKDLEASNGINRVESLDLSRPVDVDPGTYDRALDVYERLLGLANCV